MTILYAGGEDTSNVPIGTVAPLGGFCRSTYARSSMQISANSGAADPPANRIQIPAFTAGSLFWLHAQFYDQSTAGVANQQAVIWRSPDGVSRLLLRQTGTQGQWKISQRNAAGTITDLGAPSAAGAWPSATQLQVDVRVDYSASPGGVQVFVNAVSIMNYVGDPRTDAATQLNQLELACTGNTVMYWSEIIVADQDTRSMAVLTLAPAAAGNTQAWTPNTLGNINKVAISDSTFVSTTAINTLSQWTIPTTLPTGVWNVLAIVQNARVQAALTGPQHFDWSCRTVATDYLASASQAPVNAAPFANFQHLWPLNPRTGLAWTPADITAGLQFGIESLT